MTKGEFVRLEKDNEFSDESPGGGGGATISSNGEGAGEDSKINFQNNNQDGEIESTNNIHNNQEEEEDIPNNNSNNNSNNNKKFQTYSNSQLPLVIDNNGSELNESDFITSLNDSSYIAPFNEYIKKNNYNFYEMILEKSEKVVIKASMNKSELILTGGYLFCFIALGISVGSLGPTLDSLADHLGSEHVSYFFSARGIGYFLFSLLCRFLDRVRNSNFVIAGCVILMATTLILIPLSNNIWLTAFLFCLEGGGAGLIDSSLNTLIVWVWKDRVNPFMQLLHFSFGVGAFIAPLIISIMSKESLRIQYFVLAMIMLSGFFAIIFLKPAKVPIVEDIQLTDLIDNNDTIDQSSNEEDIKTNVLPKSEKRLRIEVIAAISIFLFWYVGAESGYGGWICTFSMENLNFSLEDGALLNSAFWASFSIGRLAGVFISLVVTPQKMVIMDTLGCFFFTVLMIVFPNSSIILWISTVGLGLSLASIFPTAFSLPQNLNIPITGESTSYMVVSAVAGETVIPMLIGPVKTYLSREALPYIVLFCLIISLLVYISVNLRAIQVRSRARGQNLNFSFSNSISLLNNVVNNNNNNK